MISVKESGLIWLWGAQADSFKLKVCGYNALPDSGSYHELVYCRRRSDGDEVDAQDEEVECGLEWPPNENRDVARYRNFYQVTSRISFIVPACT